MANSSKRGLEPHLLGKGGRKILIIRFSALGDVAMTIPVIYSLATNFPRLEISVLSRQSFSPLFLNLPSNVRFIRADLNGKHKGFFGLNRLYTELKKKSFDYVADFHSVLRSKYLISLFRMQGIPIASIDKGRKEKKELTRRDNKILTQLKTSFIRYYEVVEKLGFKFDLNFKSIFGEETPNLSEIITFTGEKKDVKWLGIAPFAKHVGKVYPENLQLKVIDHFAKDERVKVFVFGGEAEIKTIEKWQEAFPSIISVAGKLTLSQELVLMSQLDVMYSMDSANMHLASLVNTAVVSVWGATHPFMGFMGWNQSLENAVQVDLFCRPCSVYGDKPCYRHDYACMFQIKPEMIISRIEKLLFK